MEKKVTNFAVIGCSPSMARGHMRGIVAREGACLYAICDPAVERLEESKEGALNGVIQTTTFLGDHIEYDIQVDGMEQNILATKPIVQAERFFEKGDHVSLNFAVDHMNIYDPDGRCPLL